MSDPTESTTGQQNMANNASTANASTVTIQTDDIFIKPKDPPLYEETTTTTTKIKKRRDRKPKTSVDGSQSDSLSQAGQSNEAKKGNLKKRRRGTDYDISTSTDEDSNWESVNEDNENEPLAELSFERLLQRIVKLEKENQKRDQKISSLETDIKNLMVATDKRISSLTYTLNKLSDQVKVLQTSPPILASVSSAPTIDSNSCWLSSAE